MFLSHKINGVVKFIPLVESKVELLDELETIDELESSEIFEGLEGDRIMLPLEGTTCCSIVLRFVDSGGELEEFCMLEAPIFAGTSETRVEPSEFVIRLFDCFILW